MGVGIDESGHHEAIAEIEGFVGGVGALDVLSTAESDDAASPDRDGGPLKLRKPLELGIRLGAGAGEGQPATAAADDEIDALHG